MFFSIRCSMFRLSKPFCSSSLSLLLRFATGLFFESLSVQLSRYSSLSSNSDPSDSAFQLLPNLSLRPSLSFRLPFGLRTLKTIQNQFPQVSTDSSLTLCVFCQPTFSVFDLHFHFRFHAFAVSDSSLRKVSSPPLVSRFLVQLSASFSLSDRP